MAPHELVPVPIVRGDRRYDRFFDQRLVQLCNVGAHVRPSLRNSRAIAASRSASQIGGIDGADGRESKLRQKTVEFLLHRSDAGVSAQSRHQPTGEMGLAAVELPGMEIDAGGLPFPL